MWRALALFVEQLRRPAAIDAGDPGPRAPVVIGYSNALWRLGWRYEHGRGGAMRNVPEAMRCYRKSAGLGNAEAQSRLDGGGRSPVPVVPAPAD